MRSNLQIVSDHCVASGRGDSAAMIADVAPDARWTGMAGSLCGHVFAPLRSEWHAYRMTLESLIDGGDRIVGIGSYAGTYERSGRAMQARVVHVWRLAGGRIVGCEQFTDTLLVARAMER